MHTTATLVSMHPHILKTILNGKISYIEHLIFPRDYFMHQQPKETEVKKKDCLASGELLFNERKRMAL